MAKYEVIDGVGIIPEAETKVAKEGFYSSSVESVDIPASVKEIGKAAFYSCRNLKSVTIPAAVTKIGEEAFYNCPQLATIKVSEGNKKFDSRDNCNAIIETKTNKLVIGSIGTVIPDTVNIIGSRAFFNLDALESVEIPASVTEIEAEAFMSCRNLKKVTLPSSVVRIHERAFSGTGLTSVKIPASVEELGGKTTVVIWSAPMVVPSHAFECCADLKSIKVSPENKVYDSREDCNAVISTVDNTLVFGTAGSVIPSTVTQIGKTAFAGCMGLKKIVIPDSVTKIDTMAFSGCKNLESVEIGSAVSEIKLEAFENCNNLKSIVIPASVTRIDDWAFSSCEGLKSIEFQATVDNLSKRALDRCRELSTITVPAGTADDFKGKLPENLHQFIVEKK